MPTPKVIDLSHHNSIPKDLSAAKAVGIIGCIHKCTEGKSYVDNKVDSRYYLATQAGMVWGLYHFLRPGNMREQANFFINTADKMNAIDDNTLFAADHEDDRVSFDDLMTFLHEVEGITRRVPVIYSGHVLKDQLKQNGKKYPSRYRLWIAQYGSKVTLPIGCEAYYMWQYSDKASVAGITPPTDVNAIALPESEFLDAWSGRIYPPQEVAKEIATITLTSDIPITLRIKAGTNVVIVE